MTGRGGGATGSGQHQSQPQQQRYRSHMKRPQPRQPRNSNNHQQKTTSHTDHSRFLRENQQNSSSPQIQNSNNGQINQSSSKPSSNDNTRDDYSHNSNNNNSNNNSQHKSQARSKQKQLATKPLRPIKPRFDMARENPRLVRKSYTDYEEITIPKMERVELVREDELIKVDSFDPIGQIAFTGCTHLNPMQSVVFETAYKTSINMLVAAPTGAGKTNVAMLCVLNELRNHFKPGTTEMIDKHCSEQFKIIYIAPMKSLATEQTDNFGSRLKKLGINAKELTGDMSLTEREFAKTHIIVTTPEKWDVVTRKPKGDVDSLSLVRLLIIDEVHLLQSERGTVLEALVARTLRYVESSQRMTRIVGLSATLPNYVDVANFLCVNPNEGLFYFDASCRPVPLTQTFMGVRHLDSKSQASSMDRICYELCVKYATQSKQVMIFVHTRNSTQKVATKLREIIQLENKLELFQPNLPDYPEISKTLNSCKNKFIRDLSNIGFGIHHAGMVRHDRLLVERLFREGFLKVLVCTATLAWGVNFPAHAVIIRGTEIYDASAGKFVDVGLLDVMQIFGRAGRPQYDSEGHAVIITALNKMDSYLRLLTNQTPIESNFVKHLTDNLNAEIVSGTVTTVEEGVDWLRYTYLNVRLSQNPLVYGYDEFDIELDPSLTLIRKRLIVTAAKQLEEARMCRFDQDTERFEATDLGLIASHFYINYVTVTRFNELLCDGLGVEDLLKMIGEAQEFQQLKFREEEARELDTLRRQCYYPLIDGVVETTAGKVSCLIQSYISRSIIQTHSLVSDLLYIAQNATRIARGLFEYSLKRGWPVTTLNLLKVCKMMEQQMWSNNTPFRNFNLAPEVIMRLEQSDVPIDQLELMSAKEIAKIVNHPENMGLKIKEYLKQLPYVVVEGEVKPIKSNLVKLNISLKPYFKWNERFHGRNMQTFWLWVADEGMTQHIHYSEHIKLTKEQVQNEEIQRLTVHIPLVENFLEDGSIGERLPSEYTVFVLSNDWVGCDYEFPIDCRKIFIELENIVYTKIPSNLNQLPLKTLQNERFASIFRSSTVGGISNELNRGNQESQFDKTIHVNKFNLIQSLVFYSLYRRDRSVLVCAPTGSGKTLLADLAALKVIDSVTSLRAKNKIIFVTPIVSLAELKYRDWRHRIGNSLQKNVVVATNRNLDEEVFSYSDIIVFSADNFESWINRDTSMQALQRIALIILDDLHLISDNLGSSMSRIVKKLSQLKTSNKSELRARLVGLSNTISNPQALSHCLGIKRMSTYNFHSSTSRPIQLETHVVGFPERHYSPRMASMNKPIYKSIENHSSSEASIIFVSSKKQCILTALDLISCLLNQQIASSHTESNRWLNMAPQDMEAFLGRVQDDDLKNALGFGIGILYSSLSYHEKKAVEELYILNKIQVLICTTNYAWGSDFRARLVIVKGTEHYDTQTNRFVDYTPSEVMQMLGRAGRPNIDATGVAILMIRDVYKEFYTKFLFEPFPIESTALGDDS